jgi:hypothetical protein
MNWIHTYIPQLAQNKHNSKGEKATTNVSPVPNTTKHGFLILPIFYKICKPNLAHFTGIPKKMAQNYCEKTCPDKLCILIKSNKKVKCASYKYL